MNKEVRDKDSKYLILLKGLCSFIRDDQSDKLMNMLRKEWDIKKVGPRAKK